MMTQPIQVDLEQSLQDGFICILKIIFVGFKVVCSYQNPDFDFDFSQIIFRVKFLESPHNI